MQGTCYHTPFLILCLTKRRCYETFIECNNMVGKWKREAVFRNYSTVKLAFLLPRSLLKTLKQHILLKRFFVFKTRSQKCLSLRFHFLFNCLLLGRSLLASFQFIKLLITNWRGEELNFSNEWTQLEENRARPKEKNGDLYLYFAKKRRSIFWRFYKVSRKNWAL